MRTVLVIVVLALVLVIVLALTGVARGAEVITTSGTREMVFVFDGLSALRLSGYNGGIGLRYFVKDGLALRPAAMFGWSRTRTRPDQNLPPPKPSDAREIDWSFSFELALEKHLPGPRSVSPYVGSSLYFKDRQHKSYPHLPPNPPDGTVTKVTTKEADGSALALLGFEWGLTSAITLGAETRFGLTITTGKKETEAINTSDRLSERVTEWAIGFQTSSLLLGVRW